MGPVIIGEWSNRWVEKPHSAVASPTANATMAWLSEGAVRHGFAGAFSWAYTCLPNNDGGCVTRDALAEGLAAAAAQLQFRKQSPLPPYSRIMGIQCDKCGRVCRQRFQGYLPPRRCTSMALTRPPSQPHAPLAAPTGQTPPSGTTCAAWCDNHAQPWPVKCTQFVACHQCSPACDMYQPPSPAPPAAPRPLASIPSPIYPRPIPVAGQPPQPRAPGRAVPHVPARWSDHDRASFPVDQWTYTMPWPSEQAQTVSQAQTSSIQSAPDPPFKSTLLATPTPAEYPFAARILPLLTVGAIAMCLVKALGVQQVLDRASKRWVGQTSLSQDDLDDSKHG